MTNTTRKEKNNDNKIILITISIFFVVMSIVLFFATINAKQHYGFNYLWHSDDILLSELGVNPCNNTSIIDTRSTPGTSAFDYLCSDDRVLTKCSIELVDEKLCLIRNEWNDCVEKTRNYEAYLNCNDTRMMRIK